MACYGSISLRNLPPTERAAHFHGLRVHYQIMQWSLLGVCEFNALEWGWVARNDLWSPIATDIDIAPSSLKKIICCKCKVSTAHPCSTKICTCRKYGLPCLPSCTGCRGEECTNCDVSNVFLTFISVFCSQINVSLYLIQHLLWFLGLFSTFGRRITHSKQRR